MSQLPSGAGASGATAVARTLETLANWNDLINQINALITSGGCNVPTITAAVAPKIWSFNDVKGMQNTLQQICPSDVFTTPAAVGGLYLWQQKIIDEINTAIKAGACGCKQCTVPCNIANSHIDFTITQSGCEDVSMGWGAETATVAAYNAAGKIGLQAFSQVETYVGQTGSACLYQNLIKCQQAMIANAQAHPGATTKADVAIYQANITRYTGLQTAAQSAASSAKDQANSLAAACNAALAAIQFYNGGTINLVSYVPKQPWTIPACSDIPTWNLSNPFFCSSSWMIGWAATGSGGNAGGSGTGLSGLINGGVFSPDGTPYIVSTSTGLGQQLVFAQAPCAVGSSSPNPCATANCPPIVSNMRVAIMGQISKPTCQGPLSCAKLAPPAAS